MPVRIDIRNTDRQRLFRVDVDSGSPPSVVRPPDTHTRDATTGNAPPSGDATGEVYLDWSHAMDDEGHLCRCPVCGCREVFVRKDFPQVTGFAVVVAVALAFVILAGFSHVLWGFAVLAAIVIVDVIAWFFVGKCLVCYRCRSEFRDVRIRPDQKGFELAVGEKYRDIGEG